MSNVLIIDDDAIFSGLLVHCVKRQGHDAACAGTVREGLKAVRSGNFDIVYLDVRLPDGNGLDVLPKILQASSHPEVIIITGNSDECGAELAIRNGAWDYIEKASSNDAKILPLVRALQYREQKTSGKRRVALNMEGLIGCSPQMRSCYDLMAQAADSEAPVLITGETGTGKEHFAHAVHSNSSRAEKHFVVVDCAALPETLVASLLFGYKKGAFTGAEHDREGLIRQADGGTLFLDEVGEMPLSLQKSFLRVLQDHRYRPLGGLHEESSDFRLVAATNRNLDEMVQQGLFRKDLLFRLKSLLIELPSLRNRSSDIKNLALSYITRIGEKTGGGIKGVSPEFLDMLTHYDWPGNVRELINTIEKAISAAQAEQILFPAHLPVHLRVKFARESLSVRPSREELPAGFDGASGELASWAEYRKTILEEAEIRYLKELVRSARNRMDEACRISGLSQSRLYSILKQYGLEFKKELSPSDLKTEDN